MTALAALPLAGGAGAQTRRELSARIVMSGHSLTDPVRDPLEAMIRAAGGPGATVELSTIPGSPLEWRWNNAPGLDLRARAGDFDVVVLTERVALSNTLPYHASADFALRFARLAWERGAGGAGAEVILYASWVTLATGPAHAGQGSDPDAGLAWRTRLDREAAQWEGLRAHLDAHRPAAMPPVRLIPMPEVFAALHDEIAAGRAPVAGIEAFFADDIHPNAMGAWLVALAHFAVIFQRDPSALTRPQGLPEALARWYEALVWRVLNQHPATGLQG